MGKNGNQRQKLLTLARILLEETDEANPLGMAALIEKLAADGLSAERKGLYADIAALREAGVDICYRGGTAGGWFVATRLFELAELKLLVDIVQASRFLTHRKSRRLIEKLGRLTSRSASKLVQRQVYIDRRVKTANEGVYYNVDTLHEAILERRVIGFHYFDYDRAKKKTLGRNGALYIVSPKALLWDHEKYYLAGYDHLHKEMRHYRVDKMQDIALKKERQQWEENGGQFDTAEYSNKLFGMFRGKETAVRLRCAAETAGIILDQFGHDSILVPEQDGGFVVTAEVAVSPPFWGWLFTMGTDVELLSPLWAVQIYKQRMRDILQNHGGTFR